MHGWQAKKRMHLCMASSIRAMPEKVKPPARLTDIYSQTENCIFKAQIYSFLFQPFVKSFRKHPKSLENPAFCPISCRIVISDKW